MAYEMRPSYKKRAGAAGASGHFLEINLLTLFKLQGDKKLKDFYLAGNLQAAGDFDDVVFRYTNDQGGQNVIFLQAKSKEEKGKKVTLDKFRKGGELDLHKYFTAFLKIQDQFKNSQKNDPIFWGKRENLQCNFVIYTNAIRDIHIRTCVDDKENSPLHIMFDENCGDVFQLKYDTAIELLYGVEDDVEVENVMKLIKQISKGCNRNIQRDENFQIYHAFLAHTVFVKHESYWKISEEFLEGVANETLEKFRDAMRKWYADEKLSAKIGKATKLEAADITNHMKCWTLKLPDWFGSETLKFDSDDCDSFERIACECISDNVCTISKLDKRMKEKLAALVGNVFVFDEGSKLYKLNEEQLDGEPAKVLGYLQEKFGTLGLKFDFKFNKFPRLSLGFTPIDKKTIWDFNRQLTILTGQPDASGLEEIIKKDNLGLVGEGEVARRYLQVKEKITVWWKKSGDTDYLKKNDGFLDNIVKGIIFNLKGNMKSFVGRTEELEKLHLALQTSESHDQTVVISQMASVCGLGGIGKTELARNYAHEYQDTYDGNVIWIDAENHQSIVDCFRKLCKDLLNISTQDANDKEKEITSIVQEVYNFFRNRRSLFIFDNANHFKNNLHVNDGIQPFLPPTKTGVTMPHFLITSRNQRWPGSMLELDVLKDAEAEQLVKSQLRIPDDQQENRVTDLVKRLHNFPLALQQAIAYIREKDKKYHKATGMHFTIQDYLLLLTDNTEQLLSFTFPNDFPDHYTKTTFITWNITLAEIEKHELGQEAKKIFNIMAFLSPFDIPISFFMGSVHKSQDKLTEIVNLLADYSMINLHEGYAVIHRLVQWVARLTLRDVVKKDVLKSGLALLNVHTDKKLISISAPLWNYACEDDCLVREFSGSPATIIRALRESVRYEEAYEFGEKSFKSLQRVLGNEHISTLIALTELAEVMQAIGKYTSSLTAFQHVFDIHKRDLGADHALTLNAQRFIAETLRNQGKYDEALAIYKEVFEKEMKTLGSDNPSTLNTQHNIAQTHHKQGKYEETLASYEVVLEKKNKKLGPYNPSTLTTQHNIAHTQLYQGKFEEALASYKKVLEVERKFLGPDNPSTLITQHNIAQTLQLQGKCDEAISSYKDVLEKKIKILGPENPSTLVTQHCIAQTLHSQGKYDEALALYKEVLEKRIKILGPDNPCTVTTKQTIAQTLYKKGKYEEALFSYRNILEKRIKILGPDNPSTLNTQHNIAQILQTQGKYGEALACYKEVFEKQIKIIGRDNPATLTTQNSIAQTLHNQGKFDDALASHKELLEKRIKILGPENPSTLTTQHNIAQLLQDQGKYDEALALYEKVFEKRVEILGPENPSTLTTQHNIAQTLHDQGKHDEALDSYKEVLEKEIKILGPDNPSTLITEHCIAQTLHDQGKYDEALSAYKEVFEKKIRILGPENPSTLTTQHNIAQTLRNQGKHDEALDSYKEVLEKEIKILGPDNPSTLITQHNIAQTLHDQGKYDEALASYKNVFEKKVEILGPENPSTLITEHNIAQTLHDQGKYDKALSSYKEVFEKKIKILGPENQSTLTTQHNIAKTLQTQGRFDEALASYQEVLEKEMKILGPDNPSTLTTQHNIAQTLLDQGKYDKALASFKYVVEKKVEILGPENPSTLTSQHGIAETEDSGQT